MIKPAPVPPPVIAPPAPAKPLAPKKPAVKQAAAPETFESQVVKLVNTERLSRGLSPLRVDPTLMAAASGWSRNQAARRRMYHSKMGYGENVAYGQTTPRDVHVTWMNSRGHRANILNPKYSAIGVGLAYNGGVPYWTQSFK